jgi:hypothetical protein
MTTNTYHNLRRIGNEVQGIMQHVSEDFTVHYTKTGATCHFSNDIAVEMNRNYPFEPPKLTIKGRSYCHFISGGSPRMLTYMSKVMNIKCLCCSTMMKPENWSPAFTIVSIYKEIERTNQIKRELKYTFALKDIAKSVMMKIEKTIPQDIENYIFTFLISDQRTYGSPNLSL